MARALPEITLITQIQTTNEKLLDIHHHCFRGVARRFRLQPLEKEDAGGRNCAAGYDAPPGSCGSKQEYRERRRRRQQPQYSKNERSNSRGHSDDDDADSDTPDRRRGASFGGFQPGFDFRQCHRSAWITRCLDSRDCHSTDCHSASSALRIGLDCTILGRPLRLTRAGRSAHLSQSVHRRQRRRPQSNLPGADRAKQEVRWQRPGRTLPPVAARVGEHAR